jgi:hypothetical protein
VLENIFASLLHRIEQALSGDAWLLKLTFFSVGLTMFLSFPPYHLLWNHLYSGGNLDAWSFIQNQGQNLFAPEGINEDIRRENMIFRWTLPLLSYLTGHNVLVILLLQFCLGVAFIYRIAAYIFSLTGNKTSTALFTISIAHIFVGVWQFAEIHGYGDGLAYFCLMVAMFHSHWTIVFLMVLFACFTDERALVGSGFVMLWNLTRSAYDTGNFGLRSLFLTVFQNRNLAITAAWLTYLVVRVTASSLYFPDHHYSTIGTPVLFEQAHRNGLGSSLWGVFEGFWLLLLAAGAILWTTKKNYLFTILTLSFLTLLTTGLFVHDIDRSLSYGFPILLTSFYILHKTATERSIHLVLFFCAIVCVLHPQLFYMGYNRILWLEPLPLKLMQLLDRSLGFGLFS